MKSNLDLCYLFILFSITVQSHVIRYYFIFSFYYAHFTYLRFIICFSKLNFFLLVKGKVSYLYLRREGN